MRRPGKAALLALGVLFGGCGGGGDDAPAAAAFVFDLPAHFPQPRIPADNPMTVEKVALGHRLFYDQRISVNQVGSCASCHEQRHAFTDRRVTSVGPTGDVHNRNAMSLTNVVYNARQNWANPTLTDLRQQAVAVLFNEDVIELGWANHEDEILDRLRLDADYPSLFAAAYGDAQDPFTVDNVAKALASFAATLISGDSAFDRSERSVDPEPLSASAQRGRELFFSERLECFHCHGAFNFAQSVQHNGSVIETIEYKNNGLYNIAGPGPGLPLESGNYPAGNQGLYEFTENPADMGKFRAPTLRNIALTAPYMHDGSIATLREVIVDHYARGGRLIEDGDTAGDGAESPYTDTLVVGFQITDDEVDDLLAFLNALTDWSFVCNPDIADPFGTVPMNENCP